MRAIGNIVSLRRQQVVNYSMTEMMLLLVFMAMTIGFLAKEQVKEPDLVKANIRIGKLQEELERVKADREAKRRRIAALERALQQMGVDKWTLRPAPPKNLDGLTPDQVKAYAGVLDNMVKSGNTRIADLESRLRGGKAPGLPICSVTSGSLLSFVLLENGFIMGRPAWDAGAAPIAQKIPGVSVLASGMPLGLGEFRQEARKIEAWGDQQDQKCRFVVSYRRLTTSADVYDSQLGALRSFYPRKINGGP